MTGPPVVLMAAVARNGVIGSAGTLPWHLPEDFAHFKATTTGHVLVMGRATYESIGRPLPGRTTVVVTRQHEWRPEGVPAGREDAVRVVGSLDAALALAAEIDPEGPAFVQGGAQVYAQALGRADGLSITWVDADPDGDTLFPDVDWSEWAETSRREIDGGAIATYQRATPV